MSTTEHAKPAIAPQQVWQWTGDATYEPGLDVPVTIARIDKDDGLAYFSDNTVANLHTLREHPSWRCVGVETPHGRVMVGDTWTMHDDRGIARASFVVLKVMRFGDENAVQVEYDGNADDRGIVTASDIATDPKMFRRATEPARGPLAEASSQAFREPAKWDRVSIGGVDVPRKVGGAVVSNIHFVMAPGEDAAERLRVMLDEWRRQDPSTAIVMPATATVTLHDPRAARERIRHEIDLVLRDDARRFPAFAAARKNAAIAVGDRGGDANEIRTLLRWLHEYERQRGGMTRPREEADGYANVHFGKDVQRAYERARGMP